MSLGKLLIDLGANISSFESDMGRAARIAKKESDRIKKQVDVAMKAVAAASVAAAAGLGTLIKKTADTADSIQKMSQRLGVSTEFLSQYRLVAELSGTSVDKVGDGIRKMSKSVNDANNGLSTATRAFESLGISLDELNSLSPEQQFELIADKISEVENQSVKAGAAMDIFGRSGSELLTVLNEGADGIRRMRDEADAFGLTISQEAADSAALFNDELERLQKQLAGAAQGVALDLLPEITELITEFRNSDFVAEFSDNLKDAIGFIKDSASQIEFLAKAIGTLFIAGKVTTLLRFFAASTALTATAMRGASVAANTLTASLGVLKGAMAVLGGPIGLVALGALAIHEFGENAKGSVPNTEAFRKATDRLANSFKNLTIEQRKNEIATAEQALAKAKAGLESLKDFGNEREIDVSKAVSDTNKSIKDLNTRLEKLKKEYKELLKPQKNVNDSLDDLNNGLKSATNNVGLLTNASKLLPQPINEASEAYKNFQDLLQQFETPLETLNRQFAENTATIIKYKVENLLSSEAQEKAKELTEKLTEAYIDQKQAIDDTLTPYDQLIANLNTEILLTGQSTDQLRRNEAVRLLMSQGVIKAGEDLEKYADEIKEVVDSLKKLDDAQSIFGDGINSFSGLIREASNDFSTFFETIGAGFKNMGKDSQSFADGLGSVLEFGEQILGYWDSTSGQDDAGRVLDTVSQIASTGVLGPVAQAVAQVATFIDQLTGGGLFGTSFAVTGSTRNLDIGSGGAGGSLETREAGKRSLFRGTKRRTTTEDLDAQTLAALDQLFDNLQIAIQNSALAVGGVAGEIITGSFEEEFDKDGNLVNQISEVLGQTYEESFEAFSQRITAENILAGVGTVFDEVGFIADRWRNDAETLLDGSQLLLQAGSDITQGFGLFETLGEVTTAIESLIKPGESLVDAYQRVQGSTLLLTDAFDIMGQSFDGARIEFVTLAADITEAAGGLQQAQSLWSSYFDTFYTEQELFQQNLESSISTRDTALGDLGIDSSISVEAFRELFESVLPTLSAEATVEWLRAADAIGVVVDLESELNAEREANAEKLADIIAGINSEIEDMGLSPFAKELKDIRKEFEANIKSAKLLGASEKELALIQTFATRQINQAIAALENNIGSALDDLYGSELDNINAQISLLEEQESQIGNVQTASDNLYQSQLRAVQNIQSFVQGLLLNEQLSPLNPEQQLDEALAQFNELLGLAQLGDVDALNALPGLAQTLLGFGQDVFASSQDYVDIFDFVTSSLSGLGVTASPVDPQQQIIGQNSQMIALLEERNRLEAEFDASSRLQAALEIADQLRELGSVTGESFAELAERLGVPVEDFLADLGVSLDTLTVETAVALAETANLLGVEITDLAESVGASLGDLADQNSLINDALEQTISLLPDGIQDTLAPLLGAIEDATDPSIREALLDEMVNYIDDLPADQRDLLAPFFDQIDPITEAQQQINQIQDLNESNTLIYDEIRDLRRDDQGRENDTSQHRTAQIDRLDTLVRTLQDFIDLQGVA